jgi:hypothetical protein
MAAKSSMCEVLPPADRERAYGDHAGFNLRVVSGVQTLSAQIWNVDDRLPIRHFTWYAD